MKKLFAIAAIACVMASCNGGDSDKATGGDSTAIKDSIAKEAMKTMDAAKDSLNKGMDAAKDSMNKTMDATKDSMNKATDKMKDAGKH